MDDSEQIASLLKALKHRTRRHVLRVLAERDEPVTPSELATSIGEPLSNVTYHVDVLLDLGAIRLVAEEVGAGTYSHFYGATELAGHPLAEAALAADRSEDRGIGAAKRAGTPAVRRTPPPSRPI